MSDSNKVSDSSRLKFMPVSFFAIVMGCFGLTLAWQKAAEVLAISAAFSQLLLIVCLLLFGLITAAYLMKAMLYRPQVVAEFYHPVKLSFFPAFSIGLILSSVALLSYAEGIALVLWVVGSSLQFLFTLSVLTRWIHHPDFTVGHSTPAWFIPVVGNILVPVAGVQLGFTELSWLFFSLGLVFWLVLKTLIFNRLIFHDPLPEKLLPTLFIFIAPPAVGFLSYMQLNEGVLDNFARILFYIAAFMVILLLVQVKRFSVIRFYMSWWAYSFPLAAFTIASLLMYQHTGLVFFYYLGWLALISVTLVVLLLAVKTLKGVISGAVFEAD